MEKTIVTTGKTIDLAIEAALLQLGLERDSVSVQVLAQAKPGFLGFGASPAKVQVTYEVPDPKPEVKEEAPKAAAAEPKSALSSASRSKPKPSMVAKNQEAAKAEAANNAAALPSSPNNRVHSGCSNFAGASVPPNAKKVLWTISLWPAAVICERH